MVLLVAVAPKDGGHLPQGYRYLNNLGSGIARKSG